MSGAFGRHDGQPIAWLPRRDAAHMKNGQLVKGWEYDLENSDDLRVIRYSRGDGILEGAIRRIEFKVYDGNTAWREPGNRRETAVLSTSGKDVRKAIFTAVDTEHAEQMLEESVNDWRRHQRGVPAAKLLVVCASIAHAKMRLVHLQSLGVRRSAIATSEDSKAALDAINSFKEANEKAGSLEALVTVAMAYEGLDVPDITHTCSLTHVRSRYWLEQMFGRGIRVSARLGPVQAQRNFVYVQDDPLMAEIIRQIEAEQEEFVAEPGEGGGGGGGGTKDRDTYIPEHSEATTRSYRDMEGGVPLEDEEFRGLEAAMETYDFIGTPLGLARLFRDNGLTIPRIQRPIQASSFEQKKGLAQRETELRRKIEGRVRAYAIENDVEFWRVGEYIKAEFGKSRTEMTEAELDRTWAWVLEKLPVQGNR
jgi:hypothetical protein